MRDVLTREDVDLVARLEPYIPTLDEPRAAGLADILDGLVVRQAGAR